MKKPRPLKVQRDPSSKDKPLEKADNYEVIVEFDTGEVTERMRVAYRRFWDHVIGRSTDRED